MKTYEEAKNELMRDFEIFEPCPKDIIDKYKGKIPNEIIELWEEYGFGITRKGYLKLINPDEFLPILEESYSDAEIAIPIFTTGMGDIIVFENNLFVVINYRKADLKWLPKPEDMAFCFSCLFSDVYCGGRLDLAPYYDAVERYGKLQYDECFGYVPLLGLGGAEKVENLQKVKLKEHILVIANLLGKVE